MKVCAELAKWRAEAEKLNQRVIEHAFTIQELRQAQPSPLPADEVERAKVADFCAERSGFITSINNCHPDNERDYYRWQGHAEARRQLSERLGLPTAWPSGYPWVAVPVEPKETK